MRALIIGCGYIGAAIASELIRTGHRVSCLCRTPTADQSPSDMEVIQADISNLTSLKPISPNYDWAVNCVASTKGGVEDYRKTYLEGTKNLLEWLSPHPPSKFVYTSSTSVYGQNDRSVVDENSATQPLSETSRVLVETEQVLLDAARQKAFPAIILRLAGIYGPGRGYWFQQFIKGEARIEGKGDRFLNMIHRDDVVGLIRMTLEKGTPGGVYNGVDEEPVTQRAFFAWLAASLNRPEPPATSEDEETLRKRGVTNKRISNMRTRRELGYQFRYPTFREGYAAQVRQAAGT